ncbi:probable pectinesterase/pectinesterase inhibitor 34 [Syzygium oleosum]|uniref:probable pectinesterase/pectinesterase inhibitor 34 n=1 Tax=Syzygium oleosum TaxID=219896 RepID=UPI0011D19416|nr:probable pectinesterase/pectinesterase inhibitor 34 [Syzygium oleosum]
MNYGRLRPSDPGGSDRYDNSDAPSRSGGSSSSTLRLVLLTILSLALLLASAAAATVLLLKLRPGGPSGPKLAPTRAVSRACGLTRYPALCLDALAAFPGADAASEQDMVHISFNVTLQRFSKALYLSSTIGHLQMEPRVRSAFDDCLELLDDSVDALRRSLYFVAPRGAKSSSGSAQDVVTWLSAAMTNQDTCTEGFADVSGGVKQLMAQRLRDLSELVSNCLAIFSATSGEDFDGVPIQNRRRRRLMGSSGGDGDGMPGWLGRKERRLLQMPATAIQADVTVSQDGNGTCKTISEAIKRAPDYGTRRFIIYVRAGRYEEDNLKVGRKKTNLMFVGDGKGKTVISGCRSVFDNMTTFHTASFAATGAGFIARDITFENWAGPAKHQAVALRVGADHAVVYRCNIIGYQDTLYVHSNRQFFRECDVYGTVDFIFGNAAVVFQNCSLYARKPMPMQKNTVTAQNRKDPNQNTGISIHACRILAASDLAASNGSFLSFLGRPWKLYSRTVYMMSYIGSHIHPRGWLEWNATFALDTLYYGEYMNYGPGGAVGQRVNWTGHRVITSPVEAGKFTVGQFIFGSSWLPSTGVSFLAGLTI